MYKLNLIINIRDGFCLKDLSGIRKQIRQFKKLPYPKMETVTFVDNEYLNGNDLYLFRCGKITASYEMTPVFKTNGLWGANPDMRAQILQNLVRISRHTKSPVGLDVCVKDADSAAAIVSKIANSLYLSNHIQLSGHTVGNKSESSNQIMSFMQKLNEQGLNTLRFGINDTVIIRPKSCAGLMYYMPMTLDGTKKYLTDISVHKVVASENAKFGEWGLPYTNHPGMPCNHEYITIGESFGIPIEGKHGMADAVAYYAKIMDTIHNKVLPEIERQKQK